MMDIEHPETHQIESSREHQDLLEHRQEKRRLSIKVKMSQLIELDPDIEQRLDHALIRMHYEDSISDIELSDDLAVNAYRHSSYMGTSFRPY